MKLGVNGLSGISKRLIDKFESTVAPSEVICDGDSWVFGCEIVNPKIAKKYPKNTHPGAYDFLKENDSYRIPKIFPTFLSKKLNYFSDHKSTASNKNKISIFVYFFRKCRKVFKIYFVRIQ